MEEDGSISNGVGGGFGEVLFNGGVVGMGNGGGGANGKAVQVLQRSFSEVQGILEQNRVLIQEISQNHEARDADGLTCNVALIRELNTNIARVVDLYADLSCSFSRSVTAAGAKNSSTAAGAKNSSTAAVTADPSVAVTTDPSAASAKGHKRQRSSE